MNKKHIIWGSVALIVIVVLYFVFKKKKVKKEAQAASINTEAFPLKKGVEGKEVKQLQLYIAKQFGSDPTNMTKNIAQIFPLFGADGKWGDETQEAVKNYLKRDSVSLDYFTKTAIGDIAV